MQEPESFDTLFNTADGVCIVNSDLHIVHWNKGAERILGHSAKDVINHECFRIIAGRENTDKLCCRTNCKVRSCYVKGMPVGNFELKARDKDGKEVWLSVSTLFSHKNRDALIVHLIKDITQEKRVRKAADRFLAGIGIDEKERSRLRPEKLPLAQQNKEGGTPEKPLLLSKREIEVLILMADGLSTKAIAQQLNISHLTARNHIQNILEKLNLHSKSQAVAYAFKKGLL
jgi:PAS domain S-box-containing protein